MIFIDYYIGENSPFLLPFSSPRLVSGRAFLRIVVRTGASAAFPPSLNSRNTASEPASNAERTRWFADEVHLHDSSLRSYLSRSFPVARENVDDLIQESYLRIWKARAVQPIQSAKAFLFRTARNAALDLVRRSRTSPIDQLSQLEDLAVSEDRPDAAENAGRRERVRLLAEAIAALPGRCREIFILHKVTGHSRKEVAAQLGLSDRTVGLQTERAVKRCAAYLRKRGVHGLFDDEAR